MRLIDKDIKAVYLQSMSKIMRVFYGLFCLQFLFFSCSNAKTVSIKRETLFHLGYGRFEDELDLFDINAVNFSGPDLYMQDGLFFITDSKTMKVIQLTSYGDLLSVYYNPETNAVPSFASDFAKAAGGLTTQQAISYPFNSLSKVTVDPRKFMYIVDQVPPERQELDISRNLILKQVVLRFSNDGSYMDYLGQEGIGGTPFPVIKGLYSTRNNQLVVISQTTNGLVVNWFSPEGNLLYSIPVDSRNLLSPFDASQTVYITLDTIIPDHSSYTLYLKIDYYKPEIDASSNVQAGISYIGSYLYPLNVETGLYEKPVLIPAYEEAVKEGFSQTLYTKPYDFIGVTDTGWFYFLAPDNMGYTVQMLERESGRIIKKHLDVSADELVYNCIAVSRDGIISALLATPWEASVVWWRTDSLTGELRR